MPPGYNQSLSSLLQCCCNICPDQKLGPSVARYLSQMEQICSTSTSLYLRLLDREGMFTSLNHRSNCYDGRMFRLGVKMVVTDYESTQEHAGLCPGLPSLPTDEPRFHPDNMSWQPWRLQAPTSYRGAQAKRLSTAFLGCSLLIIHSYDGKRNIDSVTCTARLADCAVCHFLRGIHETAFAELSAAVSTHFNRFNLLLEEAVIFRSYIMESRSLFIDRSS